MSTKPKSNRGGRRPGAGRKPKSLTTQAKTPEVIAAAVAHVERIAESSGGPASALMSRAFATLQDVMVKSPFPAPRVTAARAIIELAQAEKAEAEAPRVGGKKAQAQARAEKHVSGGGKFAPPSAPFSVVTGGKGA